MSTPEDKKDHAVSRQGGDSRVAVLGTSTGRVATGAKQQRPRPENGLEELRKLLLDLIEQLATVARGAYQLAEKASRVEEKAYTARDNVQLFLEGLDEMNLAGVRVPIRGRSKAAQRPRPWKEQEGAFQEEAKRGATTLTMELQADGCTIATIDQYTVKLTPALADLLTVLAMDFGPSPDHLVGFKTLRDLARLLGKQPDDARVRHNIAANKLRLLEAFKNASANYLLIQRRGNSFRLAVRRPQPKVSDVDPA